MLQSIHIYTNLHISPLILADYAAMSRQKQRVHDFLGYAPHASHDLLGQPPSGDTRALGQRRQSLSMCCQSRTCRSPRIVSLVGESWRRVAPVTRALARSAGNWRGTRRSTPATRGSPPRRETKRPSRSTQQSLAMGVKLPSLMRLIRKLNSVCERVDARRRGCASAWGRGVRVVGAA